MGDIAAIFLFCMDKIETKVDSSGGHLRNDRSTSPYASQDTFFCMNVDAKEDNFGGELLHFLALLPYATMHALQHTSFCMKVFFSKKLNRMEANSKSGGDLLYFLSTSPYESTTLPCARMFFLRKLPKKSLMEICYIFLAY
jgi:hypothetical protein